MRSGAVCAQCDDDLDEDRPANSATLDGQQFSFCSKECVVHFVFDFTLQQALLAGVRIGRDVP